MKNLKRHDLMQYSLNIRTVQAGEICGGSQEKNTAQLMKNGGDLFRITSEKTERSEQIQD